MSKRPTDGPIIFAWTKTSRAIIYVQNVRHTTTPSLRKFAAASLISFEMGEKVREANRPKVQWEMGIEDDRRTREHDRAINRGWRKRES